MQVTASLNNLRVSPRKVRAVTALVKGMGVFEAKSQLQFFNRKVSPILLKLLNSATANAKHNFDIKEGNLYITKFVVNGGPSLKRWMPRAMGRATPILKRTCNVILVLDEKVPSAMPAKAGKKKEAKKEIEKPVVEKEEKITAIAPEKEEKPKTGAGQRPYDASGQAKKKFFSRQTFGNVKKVFRRKAI